MFCKTFVLSDTDDGEGARQYMEFIDREDIIIKGTQKINLKNKDIKIHVYYVKL